MQALCVYETVGDDFAEQLNDFLGDQALHEDMGFDGRVDPDTIRFARQLASGAWARRGEIDQKINSTAQHWSLSRMTPVDRNILRLGVYELLSDTGTPGQIVINEAIELAKRFGDADSPAFVNGVLDGVFRAQRNPQFTADAPAEKSADDADRADAESA